VQQPDPRGTSRDGTPGDGGRGPVDRDRAAGLGSQADRVPGHGPRRTGAAADLRT